MSFPRNFELLTVSQPAVNSTTNFIFRSTGSLYVSGIRGYLGRKVEGVPDTLDISKGKILLGGLWHHFSLPG